MSSLNHRPPSRSHANDSLTALQGAALAFNASSSRAPSPSARGTDPNKAMGAALLAGKNVSHHHHPQSGDHLAPDSPAPPEIGSVRDKIGRFAANSRATSPQSTSDRSLKAADISRSRTPQKIAARLAAEHSPVRSEKSSIENDMAKQASNKVHQHIPPSNSIKKEVPDLPAPKPIHNTVDLTKTFDHILQNGQPSSPGSSPIHRKPIVPVHTKPPNVAQQAAIKSSPISPIQRKPAPPAARGTVRAPRHDSPGGTRSFNSCRSSSPQSSTHSKQFISPLSDEQKPQLPPRRVDPSVARVASSHNGSSFGDNSSPRTPLTPSVASIYSRSHNNSSASILDEPNIMSEEALSNAIVASSLASSRASPTRKVPPPPPPTRRPRSRSILQLAHASRKEISRTPSPSRGMRHTLRDPTKADEEEDRNRRHHKMHIIHKHPHKHHEGDRKRWRSEVSEKERKRYEGVWAANKGYLVPTQAQVMMQDRGSLNKYPPNASEMVLNLVVRDIWTRSRLPPTTLEQIYELVDRQKIGLLTRDEFVVGMWLIDQQLKGHKLPVRVADSVWNSVARISGIKTPSLI
ncbi:hypothetical protein ASPWEDRAFT_445709 [Aspergillus wentii DTO 134E9]|uniref:EH domain-containing protein n=1 Tax=Aspergillus wentii DTO 134E9 TaxID=1073089 RepID=A0A1L9RQV5_ASPWE|nr:uncharacterized protein ASPWEDRAFT_445709 [Aspergillus wentii DTO 134E9]KAI9928263.1 Increased rDNA silencing protein [Aspergillus wentii]OJJ37253.1 hypothetical protein ASPWEDRAFT_445709 [Aspergillus wentii DTO 134E9]